MVELMISVAERYILPVALCLLVHPVSAATELLFSPNVTDLTPAAASVADKARIITMTDGTLVTAWHEGVGPSDGAWDLWGVAFAPRDIFLRVSTDNGITWSDALNVSNTSGLTDPAIFYDRVGDGSGLANYYGDSGKPNIFAAGSNLLIAWADSYCGDGLHGPATYEGPSGRIELPYRCLYTARLTAVAGAITIVSVDRITDATRDVTNEVARGTGAGFAVAWQEDPEGLQLGEARGEGDGSSGARVSPGTDVWYAWIAANNFANSDGTWQGPVPISNNYDYTTGAATGGGASRPIMAMAGSPATAILVYEEAKNGGPEDPGKHVLFHQFRFNSPPAPGPGTIVSAPTENSRRARVVAISSPGDKHGTRMAIMWRQGAGIQGAPADFMMRVGRVPAGTDIREVTDAGFRVTDLWPTVDVDDPAASEAGLNLSGASVSDPTSVDPLANAKAHRAVMDGDFIYAGYTQDLDATDGEDAYQLYLRWSDDGGQTWAAPKNVSAGVPGSKDVIEPRLIRTPGTIPTGNPQDVRNRDVYVVAWGTQVVVDSATEPVRDRLFVTRTMDRGATFERVQSLADTRTAGDQTDEQIQLRVTPDGQNIKAVWIRRDPLESNVVFDTAVGITPTADLSIVGAASSLTPDIGESISVRFEVGNGGPQSATEVLLDIDVAAGLALTHVSTSDGACAVGRSVRCELSDLEPGAAASVELALDVMAASHMTVSGSVSAWEDDPTPESNSVEVVVEGLAKADLELSIWADQSRITRGRNFRVTYAVENHGPQTATSAQLRIPIPDILEVLESPSCQVLANELVCDISNLPVGVLWTRTARLHASADGMATLSAVIAAVEADPLAANNSASVELSVETDNGSGGCAYSPGGRGDDTLPALLVLMMIVRLLLRGRKWQAVR
jgi:hypothetical protein